MPSGGTSGATGSGGGSAGSASGSGGSGGSGGAPAVVELALGKTASSDSAQAMNPATSGNDGSDTTRWCAADGKTDHWWRVDLGAPRSLSRVEIGWEFDDRAYGYVIETSMDDATYTPAADQTANTTPAAVQTTPVTATARYVRIRVTALATSPVTWASFFEVKVFGR